MNKMREIRVEKVTLNLGTGGPGEILDKSMKLLNKLTNSKPVPTTTKRRIPAWNIRPGLQIGCKATIRGKKAEDLLKRLLQARESKLNLSNFDDQGNFSFGVKEYLDVPGIEYDPSIGIIGFEAAVSLARPGFRIKHRRILKRAIKKNHKITKEEAISFIQNKYSIQLVEEE